MIKVTQPAFFEESYFMHINDDVKLWLYYYGIDYYGIDMETRSFNSIRFKRKVETYNI